MNDFTKNMLASAAVITPDFDEVAEMTSKFIVEGLPRMVDASELLRYSHDSLRVFLQQHGLYVYPTTELWGAIHAATCMFDSVIEIGGGNGILASELGHRTTDSYMQSTKFRPRNSKEKSIHEQVLQSLKQMGATPCYGPHVIQLEAKEAMRKYKPDCVFGLYITHKWRQGDVEGNQLGVDEHWILNRQYLKRYIVVGNLKVHQHKPLLDLPHEEIELDGLVLRAEVPELNRIFIWDKS